MTTKEAVPPITAEMGEPAFKAWCARFNPEGLLRCVTRARQAEASSRYATASKSLATLRNQIATTADGSIERMHLEADAEKMQEKVTAFSVQAFAAAEGEFATHEGLILLRDDLRGMVRAVESELENICSAYRKMHKAQGWPEPSVEYVAASSALYQAASQFLQGHLRVALAQFEEEFNNFDRGAGISKAFAPSAVSWLLAGKGWREIPLT
jgi:hypothetical protein